MTTVHPEPASPDDVSAIADALQAKYFRGYFEGERSALRAELSSCVKRLTRCMTTDSDAGEAGMIRRAIRVTENELRTIDRMLDALDGRFPRS